MVRSASQLACELEELIAALDRRVPRAAQAGETAIARDAAALRSKAVERLAELDVKCAPGAPESSPPTHPAEVSMQDTPFPSSPTDVAALTVSEFACGLESDSSVSIDAVCQLFLGDTNRALVWFIRFRALATWRERAEIAEWLHAEPAHARHLCEVAARFELNDDWEFDAGLFRSALESIPG